MALIGFLVVEGGESGFRAGEIEADDRDAFLVREGGGRARHFEGGDSHDFLGGGMGHHVEKLRVVGRHVAIEETHGAGDDAVMEGNVGALADGGGGVVFLLGALQAAVDAFDDFFHGEAGTDVQLRGVSDFDVADILGDAVLRQFIGDALEVLGGLQHRAGEAEPAKIIGQILVLLLEDEFLQSGFRLGGQGNLGGLRQFDQGGNAEGTIQMEMQVGLGNLLEKFAGDLVGHVGTSCLGQMPCCLRHPIRCGGGAATVLRRISGRGGGGRGRGRGIQCRAASRPPRAGGSPACRRPGPGP